MYRLIEVRWASKYDLSRGPLWKLWNKENKLPRWFWQRVWEYPWVFSKVDSGSNVLDVGGTYPFVLFKQFPNAKSVDSRDLNVVGHELHDGLWPEGSLIISDARKIPLPSESFDTVFSISALEEMPNPKQVLSELMRISSRRVILTCDVGGYGIPKDEFEELFSEWDIKVKKSLGNLSSLSLILLRYKQRPVWKNRKIRVVGLVFERE